MKRRSFALAALALPVALAASLAARDSAACGACFQPPKPPNPPPNWVESDVTDHRMVLSISTTQTVLWDQIRYAGDPKEFAWVLPVRPGTQVQLSHDEWIASLDANTATVVEPPAMPTTCQSRYGGGAGGGGVDYYGGGYGNGSGGGGCSCFPGAVSEDDSVPAAGFEGADGGAADAAGGAEIDAGPPPVQVETQETVGPYDVVVVRATQGDALDTWLLANGFDIPSAAKPVIDAYVKEQFDFVAMKLATPSGGGSKLGGTGAMQPVRIVEPGADPSLPLRMVAIGTGANVGLALWIISEGRYHPQNFPDVSIDFSKLSYDVTQRRSNFDELLAAAFATQGGRGWITEYAAPAVLSGRSQYNPGLLDGYAATCVPTQGKGCDDAGAPSVDGGVDAGSDAGDAGACTPIAPAPCDDPQVAFTGMSMGSIWITKMRALLPQSALATDLVVEASPSQQPVTNVHQAQEWIGDPCTLTTYGASFEPGRKSSLGSAASAQGGAQSCSMSSRRRANDGAGAGILVGVTALALAWMKRRRARA